MFYVVIFGLAFAAAGAALAVTVTNHYAQKRWDRLYSLMLEWKRDCIGWNKAADYYRRCALDWRNHALRDDDGESWKRGIPPVGGTGEEG